MAGIMSDQDAAKAVELGQMTPEQYAENAKRNAESVNPKANFANPIGGVDEPMWLRQQAKAQVAEAKAQEPIMPAPAPLPKETEAKAQNVAMESPQIVKTSADQGPLLPMQNPIQGYMQSVGTPYEKQAAAIQAFYNAGAKKASEEAGYLDQMKQEQEKMLIADQAKRDQEAEFLNTKLQEINNAKVDPERFWSNKSTGDKILAGIGLFLGAFGAQNGGGNKAAAIINDAINRDIKLQEAGIDNKAQLYKQHYALTKDAQAARASTRMAMLSNAQLKLQEIASRYQGPEMKARAQQLMAQLDAEKQNAQINLASALQKSATQQSASPEMTAIMNLPPTIQKTAIEELGKASEWNRLTEDVTSTYGNAMKMGASALIPSVVGGSKDQYQAMKGKISGAIVGKVPGIKSDSDFENIVAPMLPRPGESAKAAEEKLKNFEGFLRANAPATPILDSYKLRPKSVNEKLGFTPAKMSK